MHVTTLEGSQVTYQIRRHLSKKRIPPHLNSESQTVHHHGPRVHDIAHTILESSLPNLERRNTLQVGKDITYPSCPPSDDHRTYYPM